MNDLAGHPGVPNTEAGLARVLRAEQTAVWVTVGGQEQPGGLFDSEAEARDMMRENAPSGFLGRFRRQADGSLVARFADGTGQITIRSTR